MLQQIFSNALWQLIWQSDGITKIVLLLLLCMSIICWSIFLYRYMTLRIKKRQICAIFQSIHRVNTVEDLTLLSTQNAKTVGGYFLQENLQVLHSLMDLQHMQGIGRLGVTQWERIQDSIYQTIDHVMHEEERGIWVIATAASVATLLGLFGTVWGLVHAFINISQKQAADIATIAPGIAEALMTTLAGLMVAIPSLVMYNYLNIQLRRVDQQLQALAQRFNRIIQILFIY